MTDSVFTQNWEAGISDEVRFWTQWVSTKGLQWPADYAFKTNPDTQLQQNIAKLLNDIPEDQRQISILDVGAGPATFLGKIYKGKRLNIIPIDPLADAYEKIWNDASITVPVKTIKYPGEKLLGLIGPESVDIAYSRNAIDHSYDPLRIITSMMVATKVGAHVYIELFENEAEKEKYQGFHQWNFQLQENKLNLWNRIIDIPLNPILSEAGDLQLQKSGERGVLITLHKTKPFFASSVKSVNDFVKEAA